MVEWLADLASSGLAFVAAGLTIWFARPRERRSAGLRKLLWRLVPAWVAAYGLLTALFPALLDNLLLLSGVLWSPMFFVPAATWRARLREAGPVLLVVRRHAGFVTMALGVALGAWTPSAVSFLYPGLAGLARLVLTAIVELLPLKAVVHGLVGLRIAERGILGYTRFVPWDGVELPARTPGGPVELALALAVFQLAACGSGSDVPATRSGTTPDRADAVVPAAPTPEQQAIADALERARAGAEAPGAILAMKRVDQEPFVHATGHVDLDRAEEVDPGQPLYLGSVSKVYTAAVVLRLEELGRLSVDDPLERWLADLPRAREMTLRQLLDHTSGLKDFYSYLYFRPDRAEMIELVTRSWTEAELLELSGRFGHWFDPGADWAYSNTNYYLLGVVVERASGLPLAESYRSMVYEPLGLTGTWLAWHEEPRGSLPTGYLGPVEGWEHSEMFGTLGATTELDRSPVEWGAGGLVSTAADALAFMEALMTGRLLDPSTVEKMTSFRPTDPLGIPGTDTTVVESASGYGLGLVRMVRNGVELVGHGGLFTGHTAGLWFVPECQVTIAVYFNRGFVGQRDLLDKVVGLLPECAASN